MTKEQHDLERVLARLNPKPTAKPPRKRQSIGPAPVPELDPHMQVSLESDDWLEIVVPEWAVEDMKRKIRASARSLTYQLGKPVRVSIRENRERRDNRVAIKFHAHEPYKTGSRTHRHGPNKKRWS